MKIFLKPHFITGYVTANVLNDDGHISAFAPLFQSTKIVDDDRLRTSTPYSSNPDFSLSATLNPSLTATIIEAMIKNLQLKFI